MKNSSSSIKTWLRCKKLWELTYVEKKQPIDDGSFEISYGSAFHGLAESDDEPIAFFGAKWESIIRSHFDSYSKFWENHSTLSFEMLEHEVAFEFELVPGVVLHGYLDGIAKLDGKYYIVETKTTGQDIADGAKYWNYKLQDIQVGVYLLAAKHCEALQKYNIEGVIYDVTRRPSIRQKKRPPESDQDYWKRCESWFYDNRSDVFIRKFMTRSDSSLDDLATELMAISETQENTKVFVKNRDACYNFGKQCGFYAHCFEQEPLSNTNLFQERKRR